METQSDEPWTQESQACEESLDAAEPTAAAICALSPASRGVCGAASGSISSSLSAEGRRDEGPAERAGGLVACRHGHDHKGQQSHLRRRYARSVQCLEAAAAALS